MLRNYKFLIKNIGLLTISSFSSKLLHFLLVPLYTSVLSTGEYGTYDLLVTTIGLMVPIFTISIFEATLRFSLDSNSNHKEIFSISLKVLIKGTTILGILIFANTITKLVPLINEYLLYFILIYITTVLNQFLQCFARGTERIFDVAIAGILESAAVLILNIYFLIFEKKGLEGYFWANIIAPTISCIYLSVRMRIYQYVKLRNLDIHKETEMKQYSKPLVANALAWWVNSVSDRYVVTWLCGIETNGIYSVSYKIPSLLSVVQSIFNSAWQLSAVNMYNRDDKDGFFKNIYSAYNVIMVSFCSVMIVLTRFLARILYGEEFFEAWRYVPFLMISIVFGALIGVFYGVFQAVKDSKIQEKLTVVGAAVNLVLNYILVKLLGAIGAAIATAICYFVVWALAVCYVKKYINIEIRLYRDMFSYIFLVIQAILMLFFNDSIKLYGIQTILCMLLIVLYRTELFGILHKMIKQFCRVN